MLVLLFNFTFLVIFSMLKLLNSLTLKKTFRPVDRLPIFLNRRLSPNAWKSKIRFFICLLVLHLFVCILFCRLAILIKNYYEQIIFIDTIK